MENPFILNGYIDDSHFCDRIKETDTLVSLLENGNNVVITAQRRIGKTDFISHVFSQPEIKSKYTAISVDIYPTLSLSDFVDFLGKAIIQALKPRGRKIIDRFIMHLRSLQPQITFDIHGMPSWGLGLIDIPQPETTLTEIFEYISSSDKPCIIAIDEFQQIGQYNDSWRVEALLRSHIQRCSNARFIFSGSHRHMMAEIFASPDRPFYASVQFMSLTKIPLDTYTSFCQTLFEQNRRSVAADTVKGVYEKVDGITAYLQRCMNMLYSLTPEGGCCDPGQIDLAIETIIGNAADIYSSTFNMLTKRQRQIMIAIASEGAAEKVQSAAFIKKYRLGTASIANAAVKTLLDKDILTRDDNTYRIYDHFFMLWIRRTF